MRIDRHPMIAIHNNRAEMGAASARRFQTWVEEVLQSQATCRVIFGCAPSQDDFFLSLLGEAGATPGLWERVEVFHMDDYVGLPGAHPQSFRTYLRRHFLDHVRVARFHPIRGEESSPSAEAARYAALLAGAPIDIIAMGIGENGHIAFNDPHVADFSDPSLVKVVEIDAACQQQQVNDGCFPSIEFVPRLALTITLPVFARAGRLCCTVPGKQKARAVGAAMRDPIGPACPATLLRTHPCASVFLDKESAMMLTPAQSRQSLCPC